MPMKFDETYLRDLYIFLFTVKNSQIFELATLFYRNAISFMVVHEVENPSISLARYIDNYHTFLSIKNGLNILLVNTG